MAEILLIECGQAKTAVNTETGEQWTISRTITLGTPPTPDPTPDSALFKAAASWPDLVVDYSQRTTHRQMLAIAHRAIASKVSSLDTLSQLQSLSKETVTQLLGTDRPKWDAWTRAVSAQLDALVSSGKISAPADAAPYYEEIAAGLSAESSSGGATVDQLDSTEAANPALWTIVMRIVAAIIEALLAGSVK